REGNAAHVVDAVDGRAAVLGEAERDDGELLAEGVEHGVELGADVAAKDGAGLVEELLPAGLLQEARGGEDLIVGQGAVVQPGVSVENAEVGLGVAGADVRVPAVVNGIDMGQVVPLGEHDADVVGAGDVVGDDGHTPGHSAHPAGPISSSSTILVSTTGSSGSSGMRKV